MARELSVCLGASSEGMAEEEEALDFFFFFSFLSSCLAAFLTRSAPSIDSEASLRDSPAGGIANQHNVNHNIRPQQLQEHRATTTVAQCKGWNRAHKQCPREMQCHLPGKRPHTFQTMQILGEFLMALSKMPSTRKATDICICICMVMTICVYVYGCACICANMYICLDVYMYM